MNKPIYELTQSGIDNLQKELDYLKNIKRNKNLAALKEAREQGDLSENADYTAARNEQANIEERILEIKNILKNVKIIDNKTQNTEINIGKTVRLKFYPSQIIKILYLVGSLEADPFTDKISIESPLGQSIKGHRLGDKVMVKTETGNTFQVEILKIE